MLNSDLQGVGELTILSLGRLAVGNVEQQYLCIQSRMVYIIPKKLSRGLCKVKNNLKKKTG